MLTIFVLVLVAGSVQAQNNPPTVTSPIPDVTLRPDEQHIINDLNDHFSDPDSGNILTYSATSSHNSVATVSVTGNTLTVTAQPLASTQRATITVTADDNISGTASTPFNVIVVNSTPNVANPINDKKLNYPEPPSCSIEIDLDQVFSDPDRDQLSYSAGNSNESVAKVSWSGSTLMVTAVGSGTDTITVTADDGYGGTAKDGFIVEVNFPPIITSPISDINLSPDPNKPYSINLNNHFSDPDGDPLTYWAVNSDTSLITFYVSGNELTITPKSSGIDSIRVTANDGFGGAVDISFEVMVVNLNPYVIKTIGDIDLTVGISDTYKVNLDSVFADPYNRELTFKPTSSNNSVAQASILADSTTLLVSLTHPKLGDSTRIIIKAVNTQNHSYSCSTEFTVKVNFRPIAMAAIPDTILTVGVQTFQQDLNLIFEDPDGDSLSYTASSLNNSVAIASISNDSIIVSLGNPKVGDSAIIRVVAVDQRGGFDTTIFSVKVNFRPTIRAPIPDKILTVGSPNFKQDLKSIFSDDDKDRLSYTASSSDSSVAIASLSTDSIIVFLTTPQAADTAIISIEANDQRGGLATDTFTVKVNFRPIIKASISDTILTFESPVFKKGLNNIFEDPDGDKLSYTTNSSDKSVALASISTDSIIVSSSNRWIDASATVIVTADDQRGGTTTDSFAVKTRDLPPKVTVLEPYTPLENEDFTILANITEYNIIESIKMNFRPGGDLNFFVDSSMQKLIEGTMIYQYQIPGEYVTNKGLEFYITAKDRYGLTNPKKLNFISVIIPEPGITRGESQPHGSEQTDYRLFSVPLQVEDSSLKAILVDDLGEYNKVKWRFFKDDSTNEYGQLSKIIPGKAYWLIVKDKKNPIDTGGGKTTTPNDTTTGCYKITLETGWNYIGNPFNFSISIENIHLASDTTTPELRYFNGAWNDTRNRVTAIDPFEGYAAFNDSAFEVALYINPVISPGAKQLLKNHIITEKNETLWFIKILAQCQQAKDVDNLAVVSLTAFQGWDIMDRPEPPVVGKYVSVYFTHPEWEKNISSYCIDVRPEPLEGEIWEFNVRTNINDKVKLSFEGLDQVPEQFEVWLVDKKLNITQNLREENTYFIAGSNAKSPKSLELVVGNNGFVDKQLAEVRIIPETYELAQNFPNPFNPSTTIKYGLPKADKVTLKIFNISGQEVVTLVNKEVRQAGYHAVVWDGKNNQGIIVANGIYLCHFQAGNTVIVKKMAFVK